MELEFVTLLTHHCKMMVSKLILEYCIAISEQFGTLQCPVITWTRAGMLNI